VSWKSAAICRICNKEQAGSFERETQCLGATTGVVGSTIQCSFPGAGYMDSFTYEKHHHQGCQPQLRRQSMSKQHSLIFRVKHVHWKSEI